MFRISWFNIFQFLFYFLTQTFLTCIPNSKTNVRIRVVMVYQHIFAILLQSFLLLLFVGFSGYNVEVDFNGSAMRFICNKVFVVKNSPHIRNSVISAIGTFKVMWGASRIEYSDAFYRFVCNKTTRADYIIMSFVFKFFINTFFCQRRCLLYFGYSNWARIKLGHYVHLFAILWFCFIICGDTLFCHFKYFFFLNNVFIKLSPFSFVYNCRLNSDYVEQKLWLSNLTWPQTSRMWIIIP